MPQKTVSKNSLSLSLDYRLIIAGLLVIIASMLAVWKPWAPAITDRTIEVTGEAKLSAEPDEFNFYPNYQSTNADRQAAIQELTKKNEAIVAKLKSLGVSDNKIKSDTSGYQTVYYTYPDKQTNAYTLQLTITVNSKDLAQKVEDYLVTTSPSGSVTPQATFSESKRKELEGKARDEATKDARQKAEQSGRNLHFHVGAVKSVKDGAGFGTIVPLSEATTDSGMTTSKLTVQPGENDLSYSVTVVYFVR